MIVRLIAALFLFASAAAAQAAEERPFDRATFAAAQAAERPVLVKVSAWWCPVCSSQNRSIKALSADPAYDQLLILTINFDRQKAEWRSFGVQKQSTLIGFRGMRETGRLSYVTDRTQIATLMSATVR
jgi:thioredoxin 1